jgi:hypothetical protein
MEPTLHACARTRLTLPPDSTFMLASTLAVGVGILAALVITARPF